MNRSLATTYKRFVERTQWIEDLVLRGRTLDVTSQRLVGELAILYLAISIEQTLEEVCLKICCGANYIDGSSPILITRCRSVDDAHLQLRTFGRPARNGLRYMKWLNPSDINKNIRFVIDSNDHIFNKLSVYTGVLNRIRVVRNHVAHRNKSTLDQYRLVVRQFYGPVSKAMAPGAFLMSERRSNPSQINTALVEARVMIKEMVRS
jgi:hypothetical protein